MNTRKFSASLHGLRGVAAFGVFFAHCLGGYTLHVCSPCDNSWTTAGIALGTFGVEIFFLLSGVVIYQASLRSAPAVFFNKRFWRVYPVFILFTLLFFVLNSITAIEPDKNELLYLLYNVTFLNLIVGTPALTPNAWTITFEVYFYILTFAIVYPVKVAKNRWGAGIAVVASACLLYRYPISFYYLAGILVGIWNVHVDKKRLVLNRLWIRVIECGSLITLVYLASTEHYYTWNAISDQKEVVFLLISTALYVGCLQTGVAFSVRLLETRALLYLGTVSYSLYLAHPYSYVVARKVVMLLQEMALFSDRLIAVLFLALTIVLTVGIVVLVHRLVEVPFYRRNTGSVMVGAHK